MSTTTNVPLGKPRSLLKPLKPKPAPAPIVVKKDSKIQLLSGEATSQLFKSIKFGPSSSLYQEDVLYETKSDHFFGDFPVKVKIINRIDLLKSASRTVVRCFDKADGKLVSENTSDSITRFMGQNNYNAVLSALCLLTDEEIKVKAIMALLNTKSNEDLNAQTVNPKKDIAEKCCQTHENCMDIIYRMKQKKRVKRSVLTPYPIKEIVRKLIIHPIKDPDKKAHTDAIDPLLISKDVKNEVNNALDGKGIFDLPVLQLNEDISDKFSTISESKSICSDVILHNADKLLNSIGEHTYKSEHGNVAKHRNHYIYLPNNDAIEVAVKPEYPFHMATPEILRSVNEEDRVKLVTYQLYLDYKLCLNKDPDGYLPIHNAVLNNDLDLLRRQCVVLRYRHQSVDTRVGNLTALQMSIYQDTPQCTAMLLQHGADPLYTDEEHRTCLHLASTSSVDHIRAILDYCQIEAKQVFQDHEELWRDEYQTKSKDELGELLIQQICASWDSNGYTPLMLAAKSGNYTAVKMLVEASPESVNLAMPNCGNTALFLATSEACLDAINRGNKSKVGDQFFQTISILLDNRADYLIPNDSNTSVNDLLTESNNAELSALFANKVTSKYFDGHMPGGSQFNSYMLVKDEKGEVGITEMKKPKTEKDEALRKDVVDKASKLMREIAKKQNADADSEKGKPRILENIKLMDSQKKIVLDSPSKMASSVKIISPKAKLQPFNLPAKSKNLLVKHIGNQEVIQAIDVGCIKIETAEPQSSKNTLIVADNLQNETIKRKSAIIPGPGEKKLKVDILKT